MVKQLDAIKIYEIAESANTDCRKKRKGWATHITQLRPGCLPRIFLLYIKDVTILIWVHSAAASAEHIVDPNILRSRDDAIQI